MTVSRRQPTQEHWTAGRPPSVKRADPGIDRYGGLQSDGADAARCLRRIRANGTDLRGQPGARQFDLNAPLRMGATSSCRRPSLAASTGHEANMTDTEISNENLRKTWTTERVAQLRNCVNAGLSCGQIANEIGVSRNAVIGKINRLGLSRGRSKAASRTCAGARMRAASSPHPAVRRLKRYSHRSPLPRT